MNEHAGLQISICSRATYINFVNNYFINVLDFVCTSCILCRWRQRYIEVLKLLEMQQTDAFWPLTDTQTTMYIFVYIIHIMFIHGKLYQEICQLCPIQLRDCQMDGKSNCFILLCPHNARWYDIIIHFVGIQRDYHPAACRRLTELDSFFDSKSYIKCHRHQKMYRNGSGKQLSAHWKSIDYYRGKVYEQVKILLAPYNIPHNHASQ